mgnify:CR=1 FL=1
MDNVKQPLPKRKIKEPEVVKSIRMKENISRKLKYYSFLTGETETTVVARAVEDFLQKNNIELPNNV